MKTKTIVLLLSEVDASFASYKLNYSDTKKSECVSQDASFQYSLALLERLVVYASGGVSIKR